VFTVAYARTQSRESFVRALLDGDPPRGMPGYRAYPLVSENVEGIFRYFLGRANATIHRNDRPKSHEEE
jgi:cytochrome c55X